MSTFAVTFTPYFKKSVIKELLKVDKDIETVKNLSETILLVKSSLDKKVFLNKLKRGQTNIY
ncbi:MAG TPA: hypothetical protein PKY25_00670 [Bacilli bacterium]|nr:hypothetical protein [Bacilli bacterium]